MRLTFSSIRKINLKYRVATALVISALLLTGVTSLLPVMRTSAASTTLAAEGLRRMPPNDVGVNFGRAFEATFAADSPAQQIAVVQQMQADNIGWVRVDVDKNTTTNAQTLMSLGMGVEAVVHPTEFSTPAEAGQFMAKVEKALQGHGNAIFGMGNEVNGCEDKMAPATYVSYIKAMYVAAKQANPYAYLLAGGFCPAGGANEPYNYLTAMYNAGAQGYFDGIDDHPYSFPYDPADTADPYNPWNYQAQLHSIMAAHRDGNKLIMYTEIGGPSNATGGGGFISYQDLGTQILQSFNIANHESYGGMVFVYNWIDTEAPNDTADRPLMFGLYTANGQPKQQAVYDLSVEGKSQPNKLYHYNP